MYDLLNIKHFSSNKKINLVTVAFFYFNVVNPLKRNLNIIPFKTRKTNLVFIGLLPTFVKFKKAINVLIKMQGEITLAVVGYKSIFVNRTPFVGACSVLNLKIGVFKIQLPENTFQVKQVLPYFAFVFYRVCQWSQNFLQQNQIHYANGVNDEI